MEARTSHSTGTVTVAPPALNQRCCPGTCRACVARRASPPCRWKQRGSFAAGGAEGATGRWDRRRGGGRPGLTGAGGADGNVRQASGPRSTCSSLTALGATTMAASRATRAQRESAANGEFPREDSSHILPSYQRMSAGVPVYFLSGERDGCEETRARVARGASGCWWCAR